jgi:hypothetical protein
VLAGAVGVPAAIAIDSVALAAVAIALLIIVAAWVRRRRDIDPDALVALDETGPQTVAG